MQQEVHDSIEDAKAAYELYNKALKLKKAGKFEEYLMQLYSHGHKTQFKLGVATPRKKWKSLPSWYYFYLLLSNVKFRILYLF